MASLSIQLINFLIIVMIEVFECHFCSSHRNAVVEKVEPRLSPIINILTE